MNAPEATNGRYFTTNDIIGIDLARARNFSSKKIRETILHEGIHRILCQSDFSKMNLYVSRYLYWNKKNILDYENIINFLHSSEKMVQEDTAYCVSAILAGTFNKNNDKLHKNYSFLEGWSLHELVFFIEKISFLSLTTNIQRSIVKYDLLGKNIHKLKRYINTDSPNKRFEKLIKIIEKNKANIKKNRKDLCRCAKINFYHNPAEKTITNLIDYLKKLTNNKISFVNFPTNNPSTKRLFFGSVNESKCNYTVANEKDLDYYKQSTVALFAIPPDFSKNPPRDLEAILELYTKQKEIICFGQKKECIVNLINNVFKDSTLMMKFGSFCKNNIWLENSREPDILIYNTFDDLLREISLKKTGFYFTCGIFKKDPPLTSLFLRFKNSHIINCLTLFMSRSELSELKKEGVQACLSKVITRPRHFNNYLYSWVGLDNDIDYFKQLTLRQKSHFHA